MKTRTIEISEETYKKIKDQLLEDEKIDISSMQDFIGKSIFFQTVTNYYLGRVVRIIGDKFEIEDASYIPSTSRFMNFLQDGLLDEVEPIKVPFWVNISACVGFGIWKHSLPTDQK